MSKIFVHAKTMIDGVSDAPKFDQLITCEDGKITAIEPYHTINEDVVKANVVTPGFFNCHVHIMEPVGFGTDKEFTFIEKTFYTQKHLEDYINSGVTFIRVVGTENDYDMDIRDCVDAGLVKGPHMLCAGRCICMTGGHGWQGGIEADGVNECRKAARTLLKNIYKWQTIKYSLEFIGDAETFKAEGLNENAISDFKVIKKEIESELSAKENNEAISKYKIIYTLKPIRKGKLKIPELEAQYYEIRNGNNLIPKEEPLRGYKIRVFGNYFLIITIIEYLILILIVFLTYKHIKSKKLSKIKNGEK